MHVTPMPPPSPGNRAITALLERHSGQHIMASRAWRIDMALRDLLRRHGLRNVDALALALRGDACGDLEREVVEALLNHETSFFRDAAVLDQLVQAAEEMRDGLAGRRLRIWCAGCSTGQEPLSLAMLFAEAGWSDAEFPEILATDMSDPALNRARAGHYTQFEAQRGLPIRRLMRWFDNVGGEWAARRELVARLRFRRHNLALDDLPIGRFDLILCRNVLIYFLPALRTRVLDGFASVLRPEGLLLLGAGETVIGQTDRLEPSPRHRGFYRLSTR